MPKYPKTQLVILLGLLALHIKERGMKSVLMQACVVGLVAWCVVQTVLSSKRRAQERDRFLQSHVLVLKKELSLARQFHEFYKIADSALENTTLKPGARLTGHSDWRRWAFFGDSGAWCEKHILFAVERKDVTGPIDEECTRGDKVIIDLTQFVGMEDGRLIIKDPDHVIPLSL